LEDSMSQPHLTDGFLVFLRVLEYFNGILFLTTNKVGTFDEAFKSRIHISLYYPYLTRRAAMQIWKVNFRRTRMIKPHIVFDEDSILDFAESYWDECEDMGRRPWNGRQIRNSFQSAMSLAEFDAKDGQNPVMTRRHFEMITKASQDFDDYLKRVHGGDEVARAKRLQDRDDTPLPRPRVAGGGGGFGSGSRHGQAGGGGLARDSVITRDHGDRSHGGWDDGRYDNSRRGPIGDSQAQWGSPQAPRRVGGARDMDSRIDDRDPY
jgi:hypothetical protein